MNAMHAPDMTHGGTHTRAKTNSTQTLGDGGTMSGQTAEESLMAQRLVQALGIEHVAPEAIPPTAPLFGGSAEGIGLDSIDALEIALMIQQHYGVELRSDDAAVKAAFGSLRALTAHVLQRRAPG